MDEFISTFKTRAGEARSLAAYTAALSGWPVPYQEIDLPTVFGRTHIIASGPVDAPALVLLHGQESSATSWLYNIAGLSAAHRVYAIDTLGDLGCSQTIRLPASRADYAAWLLEVLEGLRIENVPLAGLSYGGFLALNFCLAHPARVERLVLLAPGCPNLGAPTFWWAYYGMPMMLFPSPFTVRRFISGASTRGYSPADPLHAQMVVGVPEMRAPMHLPPSFRDAELGALRLPVLLLLGEREIMYAPQAALQRARQIIPGIQTEIVPNAGHMLNGDQPEIVNRRILQFLSM